MLVLRNTKFSQHCFGEADILSELVGCIRGAENLTLTQVRDCETAGGSWCVSGRETERAASWR